MDNRRVKLTKRILKETLISELKNQTWSQITVKSLCEKADLNRSTFYAHYADVYELFDEIETEFMTHIAFLTPDMSEAKKLALITEYVTYTYNHRDTFFVLVDHGHFPGRFKTSSFLHNDQIRNTAEKNINIYLSKLLTVYTVTGSVSLLYEWLNDPSHASIDRIAKLILILSNQAEQILLKV